MTSLIPPESIADAVSHLQIVTSEARGAADELRATVAVTRWDSEAAGHYHSQIWARIGEAGAVEDEAVQTIFQLWMQVDGEAR